MKLHSSPLNTRVLREYDHIGPHVIGICIIIDLDVELRVTRSVYIVACSHLQFGYLNPKTSEKIMLNGQTYSYPCLLHFMPRDWRSRWRVRFKHVRVQISTVHKMNYSHDIATVLGFLWQYIEKIYQLCILWCAVPSCRQVSILLIRKFPWRKAHVWVG